MKKKYSGWMLLILIFCLFTNDTILANEILIDHSQEAINNEKEQKQIHDLLSKMYSEKEKERTVIVGTDYSIKEYQEEKAYKLYNLPFFMLKEYQKEESFEEIITEQYCWRIPFQTTTGEFGVEEFINSNGTIEWKSEITGNMVGDIFPEEEILIKKLEEFLKEDEVIEKMIYTHSDLYYGTNFIYFHTNKTEYVIPYSPREEWLGLTNGKVYTVAKAMGILNKKFDESRLESGEYKDAMGGLVPPARQPQIGGYIMLGIVCLFISISSGAGLIILRKNKVSQQKES